MKSTGIVRKIDDLGRIVLPKETRRVLDINEKDPVEIFTDGELIILKKHEVSCVFCGESKNTMNFRGKIVCQDCTKELRR